MLDVETARPLIAALPDLQRTVLILRFVENMTQLQIGERTGYSQMHISRLLAKALNTLRSQVREPDLAVTGVTAFEIWSSGRGATRTEMNHDDGQHLFTSSFVFSAPGAAHVTRAGHVRILIGFRRLGGGLFIRRRFGGTAGRRFGCRRFVFGIYDRPRGTADLHPAFDAFTRIADPVSACPSYLRRAESRA